MTMIKKTMKQQASLFMQSTSRKWNFWNTSRIIGRWLLYINEIPNMANTQVDKAEYTDVKRKK